MRSSVSSTCAVAVATAFVLAACGGTRFGSVGDAGSSGHGGEGGAVGGQGGASSGGASSGGASSGGAGHGDGGASAGGVHSAGGAGGRSGGAGGQSATGGEDAGASCTNNADCPPGGSCGFPEKAGCAATGSCFPTPGAICQAYSPGCACDGTTINVVCTGLPNGYLTRPLAHTGACTSGNQTFACGPSLQCRTGMEYCQVSEGGACCKPPSYGCVQFPAGCAATPTCACLGTSVAGGQCSESNGAVTVTFAYP